jgi:hypothetical protein
MEENNGFVCFGSTDENLSALIGAASRQENVTWTVAIGAEPGDLVVFYFTEPVGAFLACGRVIRRSEDSFGDDEKPMAEVGRIRLMPEPVTLRRARSALAHPWLKTPSGFGKGRKDGVALLALLGGIRP